MKRILFLAVAACLAAALPLSGFAKDKWKAPLSLDDINIRDPFVYADPSTHTYYMYASVDTVIDGVVHGGVVVYRSRDLEHWSLPQRVYTTDAANWLTGRVWAPEMHAFQGKFYLFLTLNGDIEWKKQRPGWPKYLYRGVQTMVADSPLGPFREMQFTPVTPMDEMALDGTLYVEEGRPYMVYCHEWVQRVDGTVRLLPLSQDLSHAVGQPVDLFCASAAAWSTGMEWGEGNGRFYVTDGCFLYTTHTGRLIMLWSSFKNDTYAVGQAWSVTGKIAGPWRQTDDLLFEQDGGHGMLFRTFDGRLMLSLHSPNAPAGAERAHFCEITDEGDRLVRK